MKLGTSLVFTAALALASTGCGNSSATTGGASSSHPSSSQGSGTIGNAGLTGSAANTGSNGALGSNGNNASNGPGSNMSASNGPTSTTANTSNTSNTSGNTGSTGVGPAATATTGNNVGTIGGSGAQGPGTIGGSSTGLVTIGGTSGTTGCDCSVLGCENVGEQCDPASCACVPAPPVDGGSCGLRTCGSANANCGPIGDGCNEIVQCGDCPTGQACGAGGPSICGAAQTTGGSTGSSCDGGLCTQQVSCPTGQDTTVNGVVYTPSNPATGFGAPDPIPNALVYIPNSTPDAFPQGVTCDACGAPVTGDPIVSAITAYDGTFTLHNVPVGMNIPIVVQVGTWRRQTTISNVMPCTNTTLSVDQTRLPRNQSEGDIPKIAMVTGALDPVECVLWKMGIDSTEFTSPGKGGRIEMYRAGDGSGGFGENSPTGDAPNMTVLVSSPSTLEEYNLVIFSCVGAEVDQTTTNQQNVINYANEGGRIYGTHYAYVWAFNDAPFNTTANWAVNYGGFAVNNNSQINTAFPKGALMANWLQYIGASSTLGTIKMNDVISDFASVNAPSEAWLTNSHFESGISSMQSTRPIHYSFDTPVGADAGAQCGRMVYSDFHVDTEDQPSGNFPAGCSGTKTLSAQEKVLEFMLFDLGSCIGTQSPINVVCTPASCQTLGYQCGPGGDGCGGTVDCGPCPSGETCGGSGQANICGSSTNTK